MYSAHSRQNIGRAITHADIGFDNTVKIYPQLIRHSTRERVRQRNMTTFKRSYVLRTDADQLCQLTLSESTHDSQIPQMLHLAFDDHDIADVNIQHLGASRERTNAGISRTELPLRVCRRANTASPRNFGTAEPGGCSRCSQTAWLESAESSLHSR